MADLDHADLVLLLLGAPTGDPDQEGRCAGITRLEKLLFLVEEASEFRAHAQLDPEELHFRAYHYGPYTREIYDAVDFLVGIGLVHERRNGTTSGLDLAETISQLDHLDLGSVGTASGAPYEEREFELSEKGRYIADVLARRVGENAVAQISEVKQTYGAMPLVQLLRYVYREHPEMTTRSRIKDKL